MNYRVLLPALAIASLGCAAPVFGQDDGMQPQLEQLFDPNASVDRIVEHRSQQMSLKAERARIDMKQSAPNRSSPGSPRASVRPAGPPRHAGAAKPVTVKPVAPRTAAAKPAPPKTAAK